MKKCKKRMHDAQCVPNYARHRQHLLSQLPIIMKKVNLKVATDKLKMFCEKVESAKTHKSCIIHASLYMPQRTSCLASLRLSLQKFIYDWHRF